MLHVAAFVAITHFDFSPGYQAPRNSEMADQAPIYIDLQALRDLKILRALPVVRPAGPGGQPGSAEKPVEVVLQASSAQHPKFTIVLKPMKADNSRQAIQQQLSAPDLKLQLEQKVPDIVIADNPAATKPNIDMKLRRPTAAKLRAQEMDAPTIAANALASPFQGDRSSIKKPLPDMKLQRPAGKGIQGQEMDAPTIAANAPGSPFKADRPGVARPRPDLTLQRPLAAQGNGQGTQGETVDAPAIAGNGPVLALRIGPTVQQPQLPVSYLGAGGMQAPRAGGSLRGTAAGTGGGGASGGGANGGAGNSGGAGSSGDPSGGIVVVSLDPAAFSQLASLAQGNRYGQLAIAPSKEGAGSPGGSPGGTAGGGSGGPGAGGDGSVGVGAGHSGGGGGGAEGSNKATFSAVGGTARAVGGVDANRMLAPVLPSTVYAVPMPAAKYRRPPLVVATGPIGGGGLDAYGALSCGKVYTIFLPMPGKNWVLQYCAHDNAAVSKAPAQNSSVIQMEVGLVPPTADQEYDFRRVPVPDKDADKMIVLRGMIDKDGTIRNVQVYQGVLAEMDSQAAIAFGNWKFRPATRSGLPIGVDVLVGIPARLPEKLNAATSGAPSNQN